MNKSYRYSIYILVLFWLILMGCSQQQGEGVRIIDHQLVVELDPEQSKIFAIDTVRLDTTTLGSEFVFFLNKNLEVEQVRVGRQELPVKSEPPLSLSPFIGDDEDSLYSHFYQNGRRYTVQFPPRLKPQYVEIQYSGTIMDSLSHSAFSRMMVANQTSGLISTDGVFLGDETLWYPTIPNSLTSFELVTKSPAGYRTVTSGELISYKETADSTYSIWREKNPIDCIYLCAGDYRVKSDTTSGIEVSTYFFENSQYLSEQYIQACKYYLDLYNDLIGPYAFAKFSVVENFFQTGYGMPSFTLLGNQVIRLPFMTRISLGHEICHNWWGNGVFVDMQEGNWCEGLTTYFADYYYKERESKEGAKQYRYDILKDYASYVTHDSLDSPLSCFQQRSTPASRSIGYGKSMMVFHMLRQKVGDERFFATLKSFYQDHLFRYATWSDIRNAFEAASKMEMQEFFDQWLQNTGAVQLSLAEVKRQSEEEKNVLTAVIEQQDPWFTVSVPIRIEHKESRVDTLVTLSDNAVEFCYKSDKPVTKFSVDPDYSIFRRLNWQEITPGLSQFYGDENKIIILPSTATDEQLAAYQVLAKALNRNGEARVVKDTAVDSSQLRDASLMLLGHPQENQLVAKIKDKLTVTWQRNLPLLMGQEVSKPGDCLVIAARNPFFKQKSMIWLMGNSPRGIKTVTSKLPHYGKYGFLVFTEGRNVLKGNWQVDSPLSRSFN